MAENSSRLETPLAAQTIPIKKREAWIEIARVLATLTVVLEHMPYGTNFDFHRPVFLWAPIAFFFFLSGFLAMRKGPRKDQWMDWKRALLLGVPFLIWQAATLGGILISGRVFNGVAFHSTDWKTLLYYFFIVPVNGPLWFLRDLAFLSLITPLLLKSRQILYFVTLATFTLDGCLGSHWFLPPSLWAFYFLGLAINQVPFATLRGFVNQTSDISIGTLLILTLGVCLLQRGRSIEFSVFGGMFHGSAYSLEASAVGVISLLAIAVWIDDFLPKLAHVIAPLGISSFLVYAMHYPVLAFVGKKFISFEFGKPNLQWGAASYCATIFCAIVIYLGCHLFYLAMKRYTPFLLPLLAAQPAPAKK